MAIEGSSPPGLCGAVVKTGPLASAVFFSTANSVQGVKLVSRLMAPPCLLPQDLSGIHALPSGAILTCPCRPPHPWELEAPGPVATWPFSKLVPSVRLRWHTEPTRFCVQYSTYWPLFCGVAPGMLAGNGPVPMVW